MKPENLLCLTKQHTYRRKFPVVQICESENESHSVLSDSLQPHGLYSPQNSPGQNTGVGSLSLLRGSSQPRDQTRIAGGFFTS